MKGDIYSRGGDDRAAVSFYRMGLRSAAAVQGFPGDLRNGWSVPSVSSARPRQGSKHTSEKRLGDRGFDQIPPRFAEALAIASGKQRVYLQQPTSFYFPGLPQQAW